MTPFEPQEQPELTPAAAQVQGMLTPPAPPAGPQADYAAQLAQLLQQSQELQKQLAVDPQAQLRDMVQSSLGDLQTYQDKQYKQKYGGGGKAGTAVRVLTDALRGFNKQGTLKDATDESAKKDYEVALKELTQQVAIDRNAKTEQLRTLQAQTAAVAPIVRQQEQAAQQQAIRHKVYDQLVDSGEIKNLTSRQVAQLLTGGQITPETRPVNVAVFTRADELPEDAVDLNGKAIDTKSGKYFQPQVSSAGVRYVEGMPPTSSKVEKDDKSKTGWSLIRRDRQNREVGDRQDAAPPIGYVPSTTTSERVVQVGDQVVKVPVKSTTSRGSGGASSGPASLPAAPVTPGAGGMAPAATNGPTTPPLPLGDSILGPTPAAQKRAEENQLTPEAQKVMMDTDPVKALLERAKGMLEADKDKNVPFATTRARMAYTLGINTPDTKLITDSELNKIIGAARVLKGSSRAMPALEKAMVHLPDVWKDSKQTMYSKLEEVLKNIDDIQVAAKKEGQRYPGRAAGASGAAVKTWDEKTGTFK